MNALRTLLLVALAVGLTLFAFANWVPVQVNMGFGFVLATWLPLLVGAVALGVGLPLWLMGTAQRLVLARRAARLQAALNASEAALAQARVELLRPPAAGAAGAAASGGAVPDDARPKQASFDVKSSGIAGEESNSPLR